MASKHVIIVVKNNDDEYLQYYDNRWDSLLFLNCKKEDNFSEDIIKDNIFNRFDIDRSNINIKYFGEKTHSKFSVSNQIMKEYCHDFYLVSFNLPDFMNKKEFIYKDINYVWYSMDELETDERIQEVNSDIVSFIKEFNI